MGFINEDVIIDFEFPVKVDDLIENCEKFSKEDNYGAYEAWASFFVYTVCKNMYAAGEITKKQWETVERRYEL